MISLIIRIIKQMFNDKRSLALILFAPLFVLTLMFFLLGKSDYIPSVTLVDVPEIISSKLKEQDITILSESAIPDILQYLKDKNADAVITMKDNQLEITMFEMDSVKVGKIMAALNAINGHDAIRQPQINYLYGSSDASPFDNLSFALLGLLSFLFVFIISGISCVRERTNGTLERLMLTPISKNSVILGYTLGFGFFASIQSILIVLFTKFVLKMEFAGSLYLAMLIMLLFAFVAVSLGTFVSIFANNEFQVMQFIPIVIIPQIFFSGIIPVETLPFGLSKIAYLMPMYYNCIALKEVLIFGSGIESLLPYIFNLLIFFIIFYVANILALKKYRIL